MSSLAARGCVEVAWMGIGAGSVFETRLNGLPNEMGYGNTRNVAEDTKTSNNSTKFKSDSPRWHVGGRRKMSDGAATMLGDAEVPAIRALIEALKANKTASFNGEVIESDIPDHEVRKGAARDILERKLGKPVQAITGEDGPIEIAGMDLTQLSDAQFAALVALRDALKAGK